MAVIKIQQFWRRVRTTARHKRIKWKEHKANKAFKSREKIKISQNKLKNEQSSLQFYQTQRNEINKNKSCKKDEKVYDNNKSMKSNKGIERDYKNLKIDNFKETLKALYLGWKTRKIMKNEHLK